MKQLETFMQNHQIESEHASTKLSINAEDACQPANQSPRNMTSCSKGNKADVSEKVKCTGCQNVYYCSKECQLNQLAKKEVNIFCGSSNNEKEVCYTFVDMMK